MNVSDKLSQLQDDQNQLNIWLAKVEAKIELCRELLNGDVSIPQVPHTSPTVASIVPTAENPYPGVGKKSMRYLRLLQGRSRPVCGPQVAKKTGIPLNTVTSHLSRLYSMGYLDRIQKRNSAGRLCYHYFIKSLPDKINSLEDSNASE